MIHSLPHRRIHIAATVVLLTTILTSCGSYQQASYYDNDGIYSSSTEPVRVTEQRPRMPQSAPKPNTYGDYFGQKADEYGEILDSEIFTDVDGYYSDMETDSLDYNQDLSYNANNNNYNGYAAWGDNATNVSINIYDDWGWGGSPFAWGYGGFYGGFYGGYYGYYNPWRWNRYGYGYGWNNWGWGGYGWNSWGWGGYGWGGYYSPYFYSPYRHYPYYYSHSRFYNNYYNRNYAYNTGRRGIYDSNTRLRSTALSGRSNISTTNRTGSSRYRSTTTRSNVGVDALERNRSYRTSRSTRTVPNYNNSSRSNRTYRSGTSSGTYKGTAPRTSTYRSSPSSRSSSGTYRSSAPTRSSSGNYRSNSSSSPTRSSGSTYRNSGGSSSSSGSIRSSGGSSSRSSSSGSSRSSGRRN